MTMEKEILEIFAAAKKAGDIAAAEGDSSEITRCLDALKQLRKLPLTTKELVATKVSRIHLFFFTFTSSSVSPMIFLGFRILGCSGKFIISQILHEGFNCF